MTIENTSASGDHGLRDSAERTIIETDLDSNIVVVASAGTGKTESLIRRMVAGVVAGKLEVESLVAITFTRMAAGEMRARFAERLRDRAEESEAARGALRRIDRAFVGTIHAFCARMLRERPLDVGLRPDFTEVDEHEVTILWRHFWMEELQRLYADGDARIDRLSEVGVDVRDLYDFFVTRSENSDLELSPGLAEEPALSSAVAEVRAVADRVRDLLGGEIPDERDVFLDQLDLADHMVRYRGIDGSSDEAELLKVYRRGLRSIVLKRWPDPALAKRVKDDLVGALVEEVVDPALTQWRQYVYGMIAPLVDDIVQRFAEYRRKHGLVTFHDLLVLTARLLRGSPEARLFFQKKYRAFFVDEFQDTDPLQAEIISFLVGEDTSERDWRKLAPRPESLFVVGDEKQSIYRFRRADISVFRLVRDRIVASGGRLVRLQTSFRSSDPLCRWINSAFSPLFNSHDPTYQAAYDDLFAAESTDPPGPAVLRITTEKISRNDENAIVAHEAHRIAEYIESRTLATGDDARPVRNPGDFMVLTRRKKFLAEYAAALESRGIPYDIVGGDSLGMSEELAALVTMLEAIRRPTNEVAMLAYLRGPLVGLADDELYAFREAGGRFRSSAEVPADLGDDVDARIRPAFDALSQARQDLIRYPVSTAFERIMDRIGLTAHAAGKESGSTRVGNLLRALSLVRTWESDGLTWSEVVTELQAVISDKYYQYEQMTLDVGRDDVVRILNLHQAKGLEADVVILADAYASRSHSVDQHVSRTEDREVLSMAVSISRSGAFGEVVAEPAGWDAAVEKETLYDEAEDLRVTYVAATRAREQLIVCRYPSSKDKGPWHRLYGKLTSVPELEVTPVVVGRTRQASVASPEKRVAESVARWQRLAQATYGIRTVTGEDPAAVAEEIPYGGRGSDYGTLLHRVFETAINGALPPDVEAYVSAATEEVGLGSLADQVVRELRLFRESPLWAELMQSPEVYSEVPFAHPVRDDRGAVIRGTIDLVLRTDAGWKVVDYKTHHAETEAAVQALADRYAGQVRHYASAWSDICQQSVADAGLWLTERGRFVSVPLRS